MPGMSLHHSHCSHTVLAQPCLATLNFSFDVEPCASTSGVSISLIFFWDQCFLARQKPHDNERVCDARLHCQRRALTWHLACAQL